MGSGKGHNKRISVSKNTSGLEELRNVFSKFSNINYGISLPQTIIDSNHDIISYYLGENFNDKLNENTLAYVATEFMHDVFELKSFNAINTDLTPQETDELLKKDMKLLNNFNHLGLRIKLEIAEKQGFYYMDLYYHNEYVKFNNRTIHGFPIFSNDNTNYQNQNIAYASLLENQVRKIIIDLIME